VDVPLQYLFPLFEPHTEWISKGKAGVPVELGLRACIMEDQDRFILHHRVMAKITDDKVAFAMVGETKLAMAVVARNIQRLDAVLRQQEKEVAQRKRGPYMISCTSKSNTTSLG
jgi:hypothetical protein